MSARSFRTFARGHLGAWALVSLLVSSLVGVACGGNVVAGTGVSSGNGAATSSTTSGNTGNTGAFPSTGGPGAETTTGGPGGSSSTGIPFDAGDAGCNPIVAPEQMMQVACFHSTFCPKSDDASAREQLTAALGYCNQEKIPCCGKTVVDQVACGPDDQQGNCCYVVIYSTFQCDE
jgi:hypothetical protein